MRKRQLAAQERLLATAFAKAGLEAIAYTSKWHGTLDWATGLVEAATGESGPWPDASDRVEKVRGAVVRDLENETQAWRKKKPIALLDKWLAKMPLESVTGRRRTVIRILAWVVDRDSKVLYDAEWLKIGDDMSPRLAQAHARRWARGYAEQLSEGMESREIVMTAIEIAFWTTPESNEKHV